MGTIGYGCGAFRKHIHRAYLRTRICARGNVGATDGKTMQTGAKPCNALSERRIGSRPSLKCCRGSRSRRGEIRAPPFPRTPLAPPREPFSQAAETPARHRSGIAAASAAGCRCSARLRTRARPARSVVAMRRCVVARKAAWRKALRAGNYIHFYLASLVKNEARAQSKIKGWVPRAANSLTEHGVLRNRRAARGSASAHNRAAAPLRAEPCCATSDCAQTKGALHAHFCCHRKMRQVCTTQTHSAAGNSASFAL